MSRRKRGWLLHRSILKPEGHQIVKLLLQAPRLDQPPRTHLMHPRSCYLRLSRYRDLTQLILHRFLAPSIATDRVIQSSHQTHWRGTLLIELPATEPPWWSLIIICVITGDLRNDDKVGIINSSNRTYPAIPEVIINRIAGTTTVAGTNHVACPHSLEGAISKFTIPAREGHAALHAVDSGLQELWTASENQAHRWMKLGTLFLMPTHIVVPIVQVWLHYDR